MVFGAQCDICGGWWRWRWWRWRWWVGVGRSGERRGAPHSAPLKTNKIPQEIFCHTAAEVVGLDRGPEGGVHAPNVKRRRVADADAVAVAVTVA